MRCQAVWDFLLETNREDWPEPVRAHVAGCRACQAAERDWRLLGRGLAALAAEPPPQPSLGFSARVRRRIEEAARGEAGEVLAERAARRLIYAALLAVLILIVCLVVPSSGPIRTPRSAEAYPLPQEMISAQNYPVFPGQPLDARYDFSFASDRPERGGAR
jgi:hypothetical protein